MTSPKPHHFVLSDLHLGHEGILGFCRPWFKSIQEHDDYIIEQIKALGANDYLWLLGDIAFSKPALMRLKEAPCHKALIGGNHDTYPASVYLEVFNQVRGCSQMNYLASISEDPLTLNHIPILFSHIPMHADQMRWQYNIHGHLHTYHVEDDRYINVSCEVLDFKPKRISELLQERITPCP